MLIDRLASPGYLYSSLLPTISLSLSLSQIYSLQLLLRGSQCTGVQDLSQLEVTNLVIISDRD